MVEPDKLVALAVTVDRRLGDGNVDNVDDDDGDDQEEGLLHLCHDL